jgi:hypothetical protein
MKKLTPALLTRLLMALFVLGALGVFIANNLAKPRVLILHSYDTDYSWTRDINVGFSRVFKSSAYSYRYHYMNTKRNPGEDFKQRAGVLARRIIEDWKPHVIIAVDDDAQKYAAIHCINIPGVTLIFAGINGEIEPYGYHKAQNVTGVLERKQWQGVKNLIDQTVRLRIPVDRPVRIAYIGDQSGSVKEDTHHFEKFNWAPHQVVIKKLVKTFPEWQAEVRRANREADVLVTTNYRRIQVSDTDQKLMDPKDVVRFTEDATDKIPVIGTNGFYAEDGGMIAIATSPFEQGEVAARMAIQVLDHKKKPREIPIQSTQQFIVYMNAKRMESNNFVPPRVYESFARAMNNFIEEKP